MSELDQLKQTDSKTWEGNVFKKLTGYNRDEVDFELEDNQAGYYTWIKSFDKLIQELVDDGYVRVFESTERQKNVYSLGAVDPPIGV